MNSQILGSHTGTIANFQLQWYIKEVLPRVSSVTCEAPISHLLQVLCCSVPPPPCTVALPECPSCSPPPGSLSTPGGQTPSRGSGATPSVKMEQTTRHVMGPGWNSTRCIYFVQFDAGPLISAVWNDVSLGRGHRWLASSTYLAQLSKFHF